MESWTQLAEIIRKQTGRKVVGTAGGLYTFSDVELRVPLGSVEGLVHDLCHWVVASPEERKQPNMGLSQDWTHPGWDRMVRCEELAWSLEMYLFGDPSIPVMASLMTPEARVSGGGVNVSTQELIGLGLYPRPEFGYCVHDDDVAREREKLRRKRERETPNLSAKEAAEVVAYGVTKAALAEMERARAKVLGHGELRPDGNEHLRREALDKAEQAGLPVRAIQRIVREWWLTTYPPTSEDDDLNVVRDLLKDR